MGPIRSILAIAALTAALGGCGSEPTAPRISDAEFVRRAEALCARRLPPLRADVSDDEAREPTEVAPTVEDRADALEGLVEELDRIPVAEADSAEVAGWLRDWNTYVEVGRRYAAALRQGDPAEYSAVADEGLGPQARLSSFARANGFESCALDGVPLPERESPI